MSSDSDLLECTAQGGQWKNGKCKPATSFASRKRRERREAISLVKKVQRKGEVFASRFEGREVLPRWSITLIMLLVFTIILYLPFLGIVIAIAGAIIAKTILNIWAQKQGPDDKQLELVLYGIFFLIWAATAQISFADVSWWKLIIGGIIIDVFNGIPSYLHKFVDSKWIGFLSGTIAFLVVYLFIGGLTGIVIAAIAGILAMLIPIPSFVPYPPYFIPIMTILLIIIKLVADYVSEVFGALI